MPVPKKAQVIVVLNTADPKKGSVRFLDPNSPDADVTNLYIKNKGMQKLGNPSKIRVTVEAADDA